MIDNNIDVVLKIVPVRIYQRGLSSYYTDVDNKDMHFDSVSGWSYYMSSPDHPVRSWEEHVTTDEKIITDIDMAISSDETFSESSRDDFLRVAINGNAWTLHVLKGTDTGKDYSKYPKPFVCSFGRCSAGSA